jgi:hypothetical protein
MLGFWRIRFDCLQSFRACLCDGFLSTVRTPDPNFREQSPETEKTCEYTSVLSCVGICPPRQLLRHRQFQSRDINNLPDLVELGESTSW